MQQSEVENTVLQNQNVRFTVHHKPACMVEYDIEAYEPLVKEAHKKAVKNVSKEVVLPGFRKGRAPDALVIKNYPKEIDKEYQQEIANFCFKECQTLAKIPVLHRDANVSYKMKSHSANGALLTLIFATEPNVPHVDPQKMQLKTIKRPEVNEKKVNETIRQVQLFFANWTSVNDRPVQEGDFVLLDVDVIEETPPMPLFQKTRFEVTKGSMAAWMYDLVLGKNNGDTMEGVSVPDADASAEDAEELKPKKVRLTIRSIDTAQLPSLDDEFAQKVGVSTVEEMRQNITALLNKQADAHVLEGERSQVNDFLLNEYPFEIPSVLIEKEAQYRFRHLLKDPEFQSYWEQSDEATRKNTIKTIYDQSIKAVKIFYICRQIVADAKISVKPEDVQAPASSALEALLDPQKLFHHQSNPEVEHAEAYSRLLLEKTEDFILRNATRQ